MRLQHQSTKTVFEGRLSYHTVKQASNTCNFCWNSERDCSVSSSSFERFCSIHWGNEDDEIKSSIQYRTTSQVWYLLADLWLCLFSVANFPRVKNDSGNLGNSKQCGKNNGENSKNRSEKSMESRLVRITSHCCGWGQSSTYCKRIVSYSYSY